MEVCILPDPPSAAEAAARRLAEAAAAAVRARGRFLLALSGGRSPWQMLADLAALPVPWDRVFVFQVDERQAPPGHADRNLTHLHRCLVATGLLPEGNLFPMPVDGTDLDAAARRYARLLQEIAGTPPVLDLVHLGLGEDGHTASLLPGDPALALTDQDVAATAPYQGRRRLTLTLPVLNRARHILWLIVGASKAAALARLAAGDPHIPAGRISPAHAVVVADQAAAGRLSLP